MSDWKQRSMQRLTGGLATIGMRKKVVLAFSKEHKLIYFQSVNATDKSTPVVRGSTAATDQVDTNYCIGSHASYDITVVERLASVAYEGYKSNMHRWYVLQIDLRSANNLPFLFMGTRQQSKAYYARLLSTHRQLRYLSLESAAERSHEFHSHYAVLASPAEIPVIYRLLSDDTINTIAAHKYPFAVEIEGDTLSVITDASKPNKQLLDELLHYGLWLAKEVDERLT